MYQGLCKWLGLLLAGVMLTTVGRCAWAEDYPVIVLGTNSASAYSADRKPREHFGVLSHIDCIFSHLPYSLDLRFQPWRRVQQDVKNATLDGFFTGMPDPELQSFAVLSDPLILHKWHWLARADAPFPDNPTQLRTGAILGSHQQTWLDQQGVDGYIGAQDLPQLIKLLFAGRIDVILADRDHFDTAAHSLGVDPSRYQSQFFRYVPLGVYFNRDFLTDNPGFMVQFNRYIHSCAPEGFALTAEEKQHIEQQLAAEVDAWLDDPALVDALARRRAEPNKSAEWIQRQDLLWRESYRAVEPQKLMAMLDKELTQILGNWLAANDLLTELIVVDTQGANVAASPYTSDYWQGDEAKFQQGFYLTRGQWFFDEVIYDQSTQRFQTQISVPVDGPDGRLGVLTLGVDVNKALRARH